MKFLSFCVLFLYLVFFCTSCAKEESKDERSSTSSKSTSTTSDNQTTSGSTYSDNGTTFTVTASGGKYYLDGTQTKSLNLKKGYTYYFDSSDSSTNSHPFSIGTTSGGGNYNGEYTSGVTNSRTTTGTLTFVIPSVSPATLYYNCGNHSGMGGTITVQKPLLKPKQHLLLPQVRPQK